MQMFGIAAYALAGVLALVPDWAGRWVACAALLSLACLCLGLTVAAQAVRQRHSSISTVSSIHSGVTSS